MKRSTIKRSRFFSCTHLCKYIALKYIFMWIYSILARFNGSWPGLTVQFTSSSTTVRFLSHHNTAFFIFWKTRIYARTRVLRGCDEKDFMSARVGARFIFFLVFRLLCLEKRKKKAKSRKEKKNRGDKVHKKTFSYWRLRFNHIYNEK